MNHTYRQQLAILRANRDHLNANQRLLLELFDRIEADHERRVSELLAANNREVERRRAAVAALRIVRWRLASTVAARWTSYHPEDRHAPKQYESTLADFLDSAIAAAEARPEPTGSGEEVKCKQ